MNDRSYDRSYISIVELKKDKKKYCINQSFKTKL